MGMQVDFYQHSELDFFVALNEIIGTIFLIRGLVVSQEVFTQPCTCRPCIAPQPRKLKMAVKHFVTRLCWQLLNLSRSILGTILFNTEKVVRTMLTANQFHVDYGASCGFHESSVSHKT